MSNQMRIKDAVRWGVLLGVAFGLWNLIASILEPLAEDTPRALLAFYGPMFGMWGAAGFIAFRRSGRWLEAVKIGAVIALATFVVFDLAAILRVNLLLDAVSRRSDWQNVMARFQTSGFESLRLYANYVYVTGAPFKILVATLFGAVFGFIGGAIGAVARPRLQKT